MKLSKLKAMIESASDDAEIKIENGNIVITEPTSIEYKFKVDDKVKVVHHNDGLAYEVVKQCLCDGEPAYYIKHNNLVELCYERFLKPFSEDITERIKTFDDACKWCVENGKREMLHTYSLIFNDLLNSESEITEEVDDLLAYLKLRIITAALNEGWEPTKKDEGWFPYYDGLRVQAYIYYGIRYIEARKLRFKTEELAIYAVEQFHDIYRDFCGCGKGGEK